MSLTTAIAHLNAAVEDLIDLENDLDYQEEIDVIHDTVGRLALDLDLEEEE